MEIAVKDIKRMELAEITPEFLEDLGFVSEQEIRDALQKSRWSNESPTMWPRPSASR